MQITIKVFGKLRHYMPAGRSAGNYLLNFKLGETLEQLLKKLPLPKDRPYLVLHNDNKIDLDQLSLTPISENDEIIVLAPVKGG
jgi:molybdopterin converting factor small subunit|tara:strand:+ start:69 stop:320 length:252 start_codon:yes stop_codon:yes gene_type:complete